MERKFAWVLGFAFGLIGGVSLATGFYTATAVGVETQYVDPGTGTVVGEGRPGTWIVSGTGGLRSLSEGSAAPANGTASDTTGVAVPFDGSAFEKLLLETRCQEDPTTCDEAP